ncbi:dipeptidase PepE [Aeromonas molluscorum]|jgi:dipeptidase E|uniref:(Alpha)-aspartyl dipeptidase n=1 Tax=Aeromonas molluscorum 848 TaxID=1268236 RepID=R1H9G3_9GAMM|nr:dipeptidase PepE [Aeromonas molluscorum]EOD55049.1 (alpha)-aspartyl dipeptidase [Aeromonas molluscorum 848]
MELLLLSNGKTTEHPGLLGWARQRVQALLAARGVNQIVLVPYAVIRGDWDQRARDLEESLGVEVVSIHRSDDPVSAIESAQAIFVSGGNSWRLNQQLHEQGLIVPIQRAVRERGVPYVGWSAGCNVATPSIRTTNDMPVCNAAVLPALGLFPLQINPHYLDASISGHMGETRDERLAEFCAINPSESVLALREASLLQISGEHIEYWSVRGEGYKVFKHGEEIKEYQDARPLGALTPFTAKL